MEDDNKKNDLENTMSQDNVLGDSDSLDLMGGEELDDGFDMSSDKKEEENITGEPVSEDIQSSDEVSTDDFPSLEEEESSDDLNGLLEDGLDEMGLDQSEDVSEDFENDFDDLSTDQDEVHRPQGQKKSKKGFVSFLLMTAIVGGGGFYAYSTGLVDQFLGASFQDSVSFTPPPMPTPIGREEPLSIGEKKSLPMFSDASEEKPPLAIVPPMPKTMNADGDIVEAEDLEALPMPVFKNDNTGLNTDDLPSKLDAETSEKMIDDDMSDVTMDESEDSSIPSFEVTPIDADIDNKVVMNTSEEMNDDIVEEKVIEKTTSTENMITEDLSNPSVSIPAPAVVAPVVSENQAENEQKITQLQNVLNDTREQLSVLSARLDRLQKEKSDKELQKSLEQLTRQVELLAKRPVSAPIEGIQKNEVRASRQENIKTETVVAAPLIELKTPPVIVSKKPLVANIVVEQEEVEAVQHPYAAANQTNKSAWILKAAQPGIAWLSQKGALQIEQFGVGDTVSGIGVIQSIIQEPQGWVVRGTMGEIRQ